MTWGFLLFSRQFKRRTAFENHASTVKDRSTIMSDPLTLDAPGNQATSTRLRVLTYKSVPGGILSDSLPVTEAVTDCCRVGLCSKPPPMLEARELSGSCSCQLLPEEELGTATIQNFYKLIVKLVCLEWVQIENIYYHETGKCHRLELHLQQSPESCCSAQPRAFKSSPCLRPQKT